VNLASVGVDLGGTKIALALVEESGRILKASRTATDVQGGASAVIEQIREAAAALVEECDAAVVGMGIGVAGQIEPETGIVHFAPNLDWHNVPLRSALTSALNFPVVITNDVRAITWGEWLYGAGRGCSDLICVFVGTGIGGGVVINGEVVSGCSNTAGEIGHITVDRHGPQCTCGNYGCMEALAGGWGIAQQARLAISADPVAGAELLQMVHGKLEDISARTVSRAYRQGDPLAGKVISQAEDALIAGMTTLVNAFNPCRLILGGGVISGLPELVERLDRGVRMRALTAATRSLEVLHAKLGDDAGVVGAAALAMRSFMQRS
jgi:glucokinase